MVKMVIFHLLSINSTSSPKASSMAGSSAWWESAYPSSTCTSSFKNSKLTAGISSTNLSSLTYSSSNSLSSKPKTNLSFSSVSIQKTRWNMVEFGKNSFKMLKTSLLIPNKNLIQIQKNEFKTSSFLLFPFYLFILSNMWSNTGKYKSLSHFCPFISHCFAFIEFHCCF